MRGMSWREQRVSSARPGAAVRRRAHGHCTLRHGLGAPPTQRALPPQGYPPATPAWGETEDLALAYGSPGTRDGKWIDAMRQETPLSLPPLGDPAVGDEGRDIQPRFLFASPQWLFM